MDNTRKNTVKIVFENVTKVPTHLDVLRFSMNVLNLPATCVHSVYKDEFDRCFFIKFLDDLGFNQFVANMEEEYLFKHNDGQHSTVTLEVASRVFRYVRIFNLPPETEDKEIAAAMSKFGVIRQQVRERYPMEYGYSVYSGIRGVYIEIAKEIPANLNIGHFKARVYYDGLKNKCFLCRQEGHVKADCPRLASSRQQPNVDTSPSTSGTNTTEDRAPPSTPTFRSIVAAAKANNRPEEPTLALAMTTLTKKTDGTTSKSEPTPKQPRDDGTEEMTAPGESAPTNTDRANDEMDTTNFVLVTKKRGKQSSSEGSAGSDQSPRGRSRSKKVFTNTTRDTRTRSRSGKA